MNDAVQTHYSTVVKMYAAKEHITFIVTLTTINIRREGKYVCFSLLFFCISNICSVNGICFVFRYRNGIEGMESV